MGKEVISNNSDLFKSVGTELRNMTTHGNWPLLERLTNDEFLILLPCLSLEQYILTQVFLPKKKWIHLLDANMQTFHLKCGVCNRQVRFEDIKIHLIQNDHLVALRSLVKQFYHPFYTYGKVDMKLARGELVPQKIRETALHEVNMQMKSFKKECIYAQKFASIVKERSRGIEVDHLIETTLARKIENPDDMLVMVNIPFEDVPKLQFSVVSGDWKAAFGCKVLTKKATFHCNICCVNCSGIESLNSHINGYTHKLKQLELLALCYERNSRVNKNCCIHFCDSFSFSIKEDEKNFDSGSWITKLPNKIEKKVEALFEYVPKIPTYLEKRLDKTTDKKISGGNLEFCENLGHLGVEYVLKIVKHENDTDARFECGLCEFVGDGKNMQRHLLMYGHKKKYMDLHYSDTIKKYETSIGHMSYKQFRSVMSEVVFKVAVEIEKHHSRSLPYTVSLSDYEARRPDLIAAAYALLHASQNRGPSFSNILSKEDIIKLRNSVKEVVENKAYEKISHIIFTIAPKGKVYLNQMSHDPVIRLSGYHAKLNKSRTLKTDRSISPELSKVNDSTRRSNLHFERSNAWLRDYRNNSTSPVHENAKKPIQRSECGVNQNIWDVYRREIGTAANEIEHSYENYRRNPESHPLYEEEWNNFWQLRKKELEREGYNHRSYNFQPEWVHYFKQRIEILFGEALHNSKINIRYRLGIPLDAEEDCQRSQESANQDIANSRVKYNVIECKEFVGSQDRKRRSSVDFIGCAPQKKIVLPEQIHGQKKEDSYINESQSIIPKFRDDHSNIIHVLRLITALEEHLGSLGGRIMDLLSDALKLEKSSGNNYEFEAKVLTTANCHLLETAMEKLKGILFAGLLDEKKIFGFNKVIQHTANLLKYSEKMGWRQENNVKAFHNNGKARTIHGHVNATQKRNFDGISQHRSEKALSDTLMDLVNTPQTSKNEIQMSKEQFKCHVKEHSNLPDCPPPPNIRENNINTNVFEGFRGQHANSGLATFDTKLSFNHSHQSQKHRGDISLHSEYAQLQENIVNGGGNLYNNSFRNSNETRTNIITRSNIGPSIRGGINTNTRSPPQVRNSQFIPNMGQSKVMYQGQGGGNRKQNWLQWNHIN